MTEAKPHLFKPGQSGNPNGRPPKPKELDDCTPMEIKLLIWRFWKTKRADLEAIVENAETPAGEAYMANVMLKGIKDGDPVRLDYLLNRLIGRVKIEADVNGTLRHELPTLGEAVAILAADYAILPATEVKVDPL